MEDFDSNYQLGCVVYSRAGRDRGRIFVVVSVLKGPYVLIADGVTHKLASPKKKKKKHLHATGVRLGSLAVKLADGKKVFDSEIRKSLEEYSQSMRKEG